MDAVADKVDDLGMTREEVLHRIAWRMPLDRILNGARNGALIPVGDVLLGAFSWTNRQDVTCNRLARVSADVPEKQLRFWRVLLNSYNHLAASKYRNLQRPADPAFKRELKTAISEFQSSIENDLLGSSGSLVRFGFRRLLPHIAEAETACAKAADRLLLGDYRGVVLALETALTHYHAVVSGIQPAVT